MTDLRSWQVELLRVLDERDGYTAGTLGKSVWVSATPRQAASIATPHLRTLELRGLAARLDDKRPIVWLRTPAGTAELERRPAPGGADGGRG